jgi:uncharacterized phosphosugar-binding protein
MGQNNRFGHYVTIDEAHTILWELHERIGGGHLVTDIIAKKILMHDIGGQNYFMMILNYVNLLMHAKELEV